MAVVNAVNAQNLTASGTQRWRHPIHGAHQCVRRRSPTQRIPIKSQRRDLRQGGYVRALACSRTSCAKTGSLFLLAYKNGTPRRSTSSARQESVADRPQAAPPGLPTSANCSSVGIRQEPLTAVVAKPRSPPADGADDPGVSLVLALYLVVNSIPLAVLSSLIVLYFLGDTINTMTLGGFGARGRHPRRRLER